MNQRMYSLSQTLYLCRKAPDSPFTSPQFSKFLSAALRYYVLPQILAVDEVISVNEAEKVAQQVSIFQLREMESIFAQTSSEAIACGKISQGTINNYRSALNRFSGWLQEQIWWQEMTSFEVPSVAPYRPKVSKKSTQGSKSGLKPYSAKSLTPFVEAQIQDYREFRLNGGKNLRRQRRRQQRIQGSSRFTTPKMIPIKERNFKRELHIIYCFFGWYQQTYPQSSLNLSLLTNPELLITYGTWLITNRQVSHSSCLHLARVGVGIAKWFNYENCNCRDWSDINLIRELQDLSGYYKEIYLEEKKVQQKRKWSQKQLTHPQARQIVLYLYDLCSPNYGKHDPVTKEFLPHGKRPLSAVARAWQTYLILKILVYCPVRQEEIRQLELGKTLFRRLDPDDNPYYEIKITEHKRDNQGIIRNYRLPSILTSDLDIWFQKWRPLILSAVKNDEQWLKYWDYDQKKLGDLQQRVELAKQGIIPARSKVSVDTYLKREQQRLNPIVNRIKMREKIEANLSAHNYVFFLLAMGSQGSFGNPHHVASIWSMVTNAISLATKALFGEEKWTNPHALRHIAEKHIRLLGKEDIADKFGTLIGHSKEMGDEYAAQITTDYELSEKIVDNWWLEDL